MQHKLILASASPRRRDLLQQVGIAFTIRPSHVDESAVTTSDPADKVQQLAQLKAESLHIAHDELIIAADTTVAYGSQIFDKPSTKQEAYDMISLLSGTTHDVYTGVCLRSVQQSITFVEKTVVEFWPLDKADIERYVETDEPYDKAGGYGIQSVGALFVKQTIGDYYNVVGLPLSRVVRELKHMERNA